VFGKRVDPSIKMSGPKEVTAEGEWGKLYNKELSGCESTPCIDKGIEV
jgi:hypothetical protein